MKSDLYWLHVKIVWTTEALYLVTPKEADL